ncbi:hypothetical protein [Sulfurospirillum oryzae]|uniref:hypothetical protein n=1 Tax=Sulfurospirillum oryzae TaxID=2976535 RepID=UPI0021E95F19|nr:hypothetical protein [Sulfurospirillum oryzae]
MKCILTTFPSYKKNLQQLFVENHPHASDRLAVLGVRFESLGEIDDFEKDLEDFLCADVSGDKRYKKRYLSLFGLPQNYDFSLLDVYKKCDKLGIHPFDFAFSSGMSTQKVLKVLLFREMQFLKHEVILLLDDDAKAPKNLCKIAENIRYILSIGSSVFDEVMRERMAKAFEPLLSEDRAVLLKFVQSHAYTTLLLDMVFFLREQSGFYLLKKSEMPLLFFVKKYLKKEEFRIAKRLKKALY